MCVRACVRARVRVCVRVCVCARVCFCVQSPCGGESVGVRWNCKGIFLPQYLSSTTPSKYIMSLYANGEIACLSRSVTHLRLCRAECVTGKRLRSQTCHLTNLYLQRAPSWWWEVPLLPVTVTQSMTRSSAGGARLTKVLSEVGLFRG